MKGDLKKHYIFLIKTLAFTSIAKKSLKQSKNIIMCCKFDAKMHFDAQNIKQL